MNEKALIIGRFQLPHYGHFDGLKQIEEDGAKYLVIGVGSAQEKNTAKNPFTYQERKEMLETGLEKVLSIPFEIFPIPDFPSDDQWLNYIAKKYPGNQEGSWSDYKTGKRFGFDKVYTGNPWIKECFESYEVKELNENRVSISASMVREKLGKGEDISEYTNKNVTQYLSSINAQKRLENLLPNPRNPELATDAIIEYRNGIVLIDRKNEPLGWALPGGFIDYGESAENAVVREAEEETNLDFEIDKQLNFYSDPKADPRKHIATAAFYGKGFGSLEAKDDAKGAMIVTPESAAEMKLAFPRHNQIIKDYMNKKEEEKILKEYRISQQKKVNSMIECELLNM